MQISCLTAQNMHNPIGLASPAPGLSYRLDSGLQGDGQTAYQILAASEPGLLREEAADLWNSGRVEGSAPYAIPYEGAPLSSRQGVYWKVRVWDVRGQVSDWSETAYFEMGLLRDDDWKGCWIGRGDDFKGDKSSAPAFADEFEVGRLEEVCRARLYISGLGLFAASVNGAGAADALFEPGESEYASRVYYAAYDVLPHLREGKNVLGVLLGNGQYVNYAVDPVMKLGDGTLVEKHRYQKDDTVYLRDGICGDMKLLAQIELTRRDGSVETVAVSGPSWRYEESPITFQNWYGGEDYDGVRALEMQGWDTPEGKREDWKQAEAMQPPKGKLCAKEFPPVRIWERWQAASVSPLPGGRWLVDMGKNSAGFVCLKLHDTSKYAGQKIELYPAEVLNTDGSGVDQASCTQSFDRLFDCKVMDSYRIAGTGTEEWHPIFCYHGFQYVEVAGFPGIPTPENFEGCAVRLMNEKVSDFQTDNEVINRINQITDRSIESNMMFSFTDCPQIEKLGWLETTQLMFSSMAAGYDIRAWIPKILLDMKDAQVTEERLHEKTMDKDTARYPGLRTDNFQDQETEDPGFVPGIAPGYFRIGNLYRDPNWGGACVLTPWYYYLEYGDKRILSGNYAMMKAYTDHLERRADNGVLRGYAHMGEWGQLREDTPAVLVATCAFYLIADTMSRIGEVLDEKEDAERYSALSERIRSGFYADEACFHKETGRYGNGSQASCGCVLFSGIIKPEEKQNALNGLLQAVADKEDHLTSGEVGLKQVFCALADNGRSDVVYRMVMNPTEPSYRHHVDHGLTTLPEFWNYTELWNGFGRSRNHAMMGHVKEWLCRYVMGIVPTAPGYAALRIQPWLGEDIHSVSGSIHTVRGPVRMNCRKTDKKLRLEAEIPVGAATEVWIPCPSEGSCWLVNGEQRTPVCGERKGEFLVLTDIAHGKYVWEADV